MLSGLSPELGTTGHIANTGGGVGAVEGNSTQQRNKSILVSRTIGHAEVRSSGDKRSNKIGTEEGLLKESITQGGGPCYPGEELWDLPALVETCAPESRHRQSATLFNVLPLFWGDSSSVNA